MERLPYVPLFSDPPPDPPLEGIGNTVSTPFEEPPDGFPPEENEILDNSWFDDVNEGF